MAQRLAQPGDQIVDGLDVSDEDRAKIYRDNALKLLKLNGQS